jgi:hypothetical protein
MIVSNYRLRLLPAKNTGMSIVCIVVSVIFLGDAYVTKAFKGALG